MSSARWQADRLTAGAGPSAVRKALTLLGGILQRAHESGKIPTNPGRLVRKAPTRRPAEVQALAPGTVEAMRAVSQPRDAMLLAVLAYAGLRPGEALALRWTDLRENTILVERAVSLGQVKGTKTGQNRTVRLLSPLAVDFREWKMRCGRPANDCPRLPRPRRSALERAGLPILAPPSLPPGCRPSRSGDPPAVRPAPQLRLTAAPRGPQRDLRRSPTRPRGKPHPRHLRSRD